MPTLKPITIIGGGLAGLTLGIGLRRRGIPVTVWEAGHYPRHRVCGEFISGRGQQVLARLGLFERFVSAGAVPARTGAFFLLGARTPVRPLPAPALCLSRFSMDALLAGIFRQAGGDLREGQRWRESDLPEGFVRASGRRLQSREGRWRWFGVKVHARDVAMAADLEMHAMPNGYIGLCRLGAREVNVCGLFRRCTAAADSPLPRTPLAGGAPLRPGTGRGPGSEGGDSCVPGPLQASIFRGALASSASERLGKAVFEEATFCSVAGLSLGPQRAAASAECRLGDALTMIPPVTGNGMSMAFEAAELATEPLAAYSRGEIGWARACQLIAGACDTAFARRLLWARWLQWIMFTPVLHRRPAALALHSAWFWRLMFERTR